MRTSLTGVDLKEYGLFIDGSIGPGASGQSFESIDPARGRPWARFAEAGEEDVNRAVQSARRAYGSEAWRGLSPAQRGRLLMRLGDAIGDNAERLAALETQDNGKLYKEQLAQMKAVPEWLYYFGGLADKIEGGVIPVPRPDVLNYTVPEPLGPVGIIKPWNSPMMLTMMAVAPALAAGNTVVIKPSEVCSSSLCEVMDMVNEVGFPPGVVNVITGHGSAGARLVEHEDIAKVTFTGGTATGRKIASVASERLARVTLELGGKSPNIVFADADLDAAEAGVLAGIYAAAGQTCIAGSRLLVQESIYDEFVERIRKRADRIVVGDPMDSASEMGPLATAQLLSQVREYVDEARSEGAEVLAGGEPAVVEGFEEGYWYRPTLVTGVTNTSRICREEVFGPVLAVMPFRDEEEAVRIGNDTQFGLAAGVWTLNIKRAHRVARALNAGTVWVNMYRAAAYNSPVGGFKSSGIGKENGHEAIREYLQTKSVWCELGERVDDPFVLDV